MAASKKEPLHIPLVFGSTATGANELKARLRAATDAMIEAKVMRTALGGEDESPAPSTSHELATLTGTAVTQAKDLVEMHRETAAFERDRRQEAEQQVGEAVAGAVQENDSKWAVFMQMAQENHKTVLSLLQQNHQNMLALREQEMTHTLGSLEQRLAAAEQRWEQERQHLTAQQQIEVERVRAEAQKQQDLLQLQHQLAEKDKDYAYQLELLKRGGGSSPEQEYYRHYYAAQGELLHLDVEDKRHQAEIDRKKRESQAELYGWLKDKGEEVLGIVGTAVQNLGNQPGAGLPRNGMEANPPPLPVPTPEPEMPPVGPPPSEAPRGLSPVITSFASRRATHGGV